MAAIANTHNAFRFAAGPLSGGMPCRGAFTAMSQFLLLEPDHVKPVHRSHRYRHARHLASTPKVGPEL
jgi:hypothetical protein